MQFIRIINFEKFQHYRDRKPPWIKLYRDLLSDERLFDLSEADRWVLVGLFLVASQHDNRIPIKTAWLQKELSIKRAIPLKSLMDTGWIELMEQDASKVLHASAVLAECQHDASPRALAREETEKRREETEREKSASAGASIFDQAAAFEITWDGYPNKDGRKAAERHFGSSVKNEKDLADLTTALKNYRGHLAANAWKQPKSGSTWFNNWRDWIDWKEPISGNGNGHHSGMIDRVEEAPADHVHTCNYCNPPHPWTCDLAEACGMKADIACPEFARRYA